MKSAACQELYVRTHHKGTPAGVTITNVQWPFIQPQAASMLRANEASHQLIRHALRTAPAELGNRMVVILSNRAHNNSVHGHVSDTPDHLVFGKDLNDYLVGLERPNVSEPGRILIQDM